MQKNSWISVSLKVMMVIGVMNVLHKNQLFIGLAKGLDVSYLTSFKSLDIDEIVNVPLHLINTEDTSTMLVHQVSPNQSQALESKQEEATNNLQDKANKKKIYIYNTHQYEEYQTHTVMDGARHLKGTLEKLGYEVIVEENDFEAYKRANNMDLTETYPTSKIFLDKAIEKHGPFDLIIDFHRDAISKDASTFTTSNKSYAKMMMVVSLSSTNHASVEANSATLHEQVDLVQPGIMRYDFKREYAFYNQQCAPKMLLMEIGGMENTYQEVTNSLDVLAIAIDNCLKEDMFQ